MGLYKLDRFIKDFSDRTWKNMEIIKKSSNSYEVTQLLNSFLGLIVLPNSAFFEGNMKANDLNCNINYKDEIGKIDIIVKKCIQENRYYNSYSEKKGAISILKHIRNSVSHGGNKGIIFCPIPKEIDECKDIEITHIIFYDHHVNKKNQEMYIKLTIDEIKQLIKSATNLYVEYESSQPSRKWIDEENNFTNKVENADNNSEYLDFDLYIEKQNSQAQRR